MAYIIADYAYWTEAWEYVSEIGETPADTCATLVPYTHKGAAPKPPVKFARKVDAKQILDALRARAQRDWDKHGHLYKANGRRKPQWKVYKVQD